jgi:ADP-ribose pyrophosphatase YjhB (NUDIX family)
MVKSDGQRVYFLPGGGIQFGERSCDAIGREIQEEIGVKVRDVRCIGAYDSIGTTSEGFKFHHIHLVYEVVPEDPSFYLRDIVTVTDERPNGKMEFKAVWKPIQDFRQGRALIDDDLLNLIA